MVQLRAGSFVQVDRLVITEDDGAFPHQAVIISQIDQVVLLAL
jgi:hypothetical protein